MVKPQCITIRQQVADLLDGPQLVDMSDPKKIRLADGRCFKVEIYESLDDEENSSALFPSASAVSIGQIIGGLLRRRAR